MDKAELRQAFKEIQENMSEVAVLIGSSTNLLQDIKKHVTASDDKQLIFMTGQLADNLMILELEANRVTTQYLRQIIFRCLKEGE